MHAVTITSFVAALMGTIVAAQTNSVANLYLLGFDNDEEDQAPFVGSIIASDASATTYSITCGSTAAASATASSLSDDYGCGVPESFTFTQGPSTLAYTYTAAFPMDDMTVTGSASGVAATDIAYETYAVNCVISGSSSADCTAADVETAGTLSFATAKTTILTDTDLATLLAGIPVTITAGLSSGSGSSSSAATKTSSGASATSSDKSSTTATGSNKSSATASSSASGSAASTGGMPMMTAKAQWVVGGAAAAMIMAAL